MRSYMFSVAVAMLVSVTAPVTTTMTTTTTRMKNKRCTITQFARAMDLSGIRLSNAEVNEIAEYYGSTEVSFPIFALLFALANSTLFSTLLRLSRVSRRCRSASSATK